MDVTQAPKRIPRFKEFFQVKATMTVCRAHTVLILAGLSILFIPGCTADDVSGNFLARVGQREFTKSDLQSALGAITLKRDSTEAAKQIIAKWITNEVLFIEAQRRGLGSDPGIRILLRENERSILVNRLLEELYDEDKTRITRSDLEEYYEQHHDQLAISEPFVRLRYTAVVSRDTAIVAKAAMLELPFLSNPDSAWTDLTDRFTPDDGSFLALSNSYYPVSRVSASIPGLQVLLSTLNIGEVVDPFESRGKFHVIQLVDRLEPGSIPELGMIEEFIRSRVIIEARKQMLARQVQRLRNEAIAREELEIK